MCHTSSNAVIKCPRCLMSGSTKLEAAIGDTLESRGLTVERKFKPDWLRSPETGRKLELDIYLPDIDVAFEINGAWSHNSGDTKFSSKPTSFHDWKTSICRDNGVKLYHIWEHWTSNLNGPKYALAKLGIFDTTHFARQLSVRVPPKQDVYTLLQGSHKQGYCAYS